MTADDGGPAFPGYDFEAQSDPNKSALFPGMKLRDWFAGQALAAIITNTANYECLLSDSDTPIAEHCYAMADAMLKARLRGDDHGE